MKHYDLDKDKINQLLDTKVICSSPFSWSASIIIVPKSDGGKCLVINYTALNKVTQNSSGPCLKLKKSSQFE